MAYPGRTTPQLVQGVIQVDTTTWPDITPFVDLANELVTECCVTNPINAAGNGLKFQTYSDHRLQLIETWLAAHFYACADTPTSMEKAGDVAESLQRKIDVGLRQTVYGQQAMRLDTNGFLASLDNVLNKIEIPKKIGVIYLGTRCGSLQPNFQIDADNSL